MITVHLNQDESIDLKTNIHPYQAYIKHSFEELIQEFNLNVDYSTIDPKVMSSNLMIFDMSDKRYDIIPNKVLNIDLMNKGLNDFKYKLEGIVVKESDNFDLYLIDPETGNFNSIDLSNAEPIEFEDLT